MVKSIERIGNNERFREGSLKAPPPPLSLWEWVLDVE